MREANELQWKHELERMLSVLHQDDCKILSDKKPAQWKVCIADVLMRYTAARNVWVADQLNMGEPLSISMQTSRFRQENPDRDAAYLEFIQNITK